MGPQAPAPPQGSASSFLPFLPHPAHPHPLAGLPLHWGDLQKFGGYGTHGTHDLGRELTTTKSQQRAQPCRFGVRAAAPQEMKERLAVSKQPGLLLLHAG